MGVGLRVLLKAHQADYMDFTSRSGFVITVQSSDVASFPMDLGTFVPVGYVTSLGVTVVSVLLLIKNDQKHESYRHTSTNCRRHTANA